MLGEWKGKWWQHLPQTQMSKNLKRPPETCAWTSTNQNLRGGNKRNRTRKESIHSLDALQKLLYCQPLLAQRRGGAWEGWKLQQQQTGRPPGLQAQESRGQGAKQHQGRQSPKPWKFPQMLSGRSSCWGGLEGQSPNRAEKADEGGWLGWSQGETPGGAEPRSPGKQDGRRPQAAEPMGSEDAAWGGRGKRPKKDLILRHQAATWGRGGHTVNPAGKHQSREPTNQPGTGQGVSRAVPLCPAPQG